MTFREKYRQRVFENRVQRKLIWIEEGLSYGGVEKTA
jgi:hypothetical protein